MIYVPCIPWKYGDINMGTFPTVITGSKDNLQFKLINNLGVVRRMVVKEFIFKDNLIVKFNSRDS